MTAPGPGALPRRDDTTVAALGRHLRARKSVRGFLPEPLAQAQLEELFALAQSAASWCNVQPWRVAVTMPPVTDQVRAALVSAAKSELPAPELPFPLDYPEPYAQLRRGCGIALYQAMGIARDDKAKRYQAWLRNFELFDAPHLAVVSVDRRLGPYALIDVGTYLGVLMTCAEPLGIDLCAMASVATYPQVLRAHLPIAAEQTIVFGLALGREDTRVPANACRTTRESVAANVQFVGETVRIDTVGGVGSGDGEATAVRSQPE